MSVKFSKYEGAGNDFILIDNRAGTFGALEEIVAALCDRRFGIGADGLMLLEEAEGYDFRMRYFNSDGPEASMCGNGGRCITLFAHHLGIGGKLKNFMAVDGSHEAEVIAEDRELGTISLQMIDAGRPVKMGEGYFVNTGSPHYVEYVEDIDFVDVYNRGRELRYSAMLEQYGGANINFVQVAAPGQIRIRTYERGVEAETLACGTGAVAAAITTSSMLNEDIMCFGVSARGGLLEVSFCAEGQGVYSDVRLTGPARKVFEGQFDTENFLSERLFLQKNV